MSHEEDSVICSSYVDDKLLTDTLEEISKSLETQIADCTKDIKDQTKITQRGIKNIDEQLFALSEMKKQLKIEMAQFNKQGSDKIDELLSRKLFIDKLFIKYRKSIKNKFHISRILFTTKPRSHGGSKILCTHCGHFEQSSKAMNLHVIKHQNESSRLSSKEWKEKLIDVLKYHQTHLHDFAKQTRNDMLQSNQPILPPLTPVNPQHVYHIPPRHSQYQTNAMNHNKNILKQHHDNTNNILQFPQTMDMNTVSKLIIVGKKIDHRDCKGRFWRAIIIEKSGNKCRIQYHYNGWNNTKYQDWGYPRRQSQRYASYCSISTRKLHRQCMKHINSNKAKSRKDNYLEVKPLHLYHHNIYKMNYEQNPFDPITIEDCNQYLKWYIAQAIGKDPHSAQVKVVLFQYNKNNNQWTKPKDHHQYWVHLDNDKECAPLNTNISQPLIDLQ